MKRKLLYYVFTLVLAFTLFSSFFPSKASADVNSDASTFCKSAFAFNGKNPDGSPTTESNARYTACVAGYFQQKTNPTVGETSFCNTKFSGIQSGACVRGWDAAKNSETTAPPGTNFVNDACAAFSGDKLTSCVHDLNTYCSDYAKKDSTNPDPVTTLKNCYKGVQAKTGGQANPCGSLSGHQKDACNAGFTNAKDPSGGGGGGSGSSDDTSACITNSTTTLEWLGCPIITAISKGADIMNNTIEGLLNFSTSSYLPNNGGAHKAWTIIKDLVSSVLIIFLLIMVISQAIGSGIFEAYTVKKVLPRLVIAVVGMQLSWTLCIFIIGIANDLGEGIKQIMAAPFGGGGNLDLPSLLHHLSGEWAGVTELTLTGALVSSIFLGAVFLPGALLVVFTVLMAVLVGLATVLFRNIIIIACVMFSPLAILLWVAPGQSMRGYWKTYSDNFTKALLLFPLMIAIIYGGRIFAWIAGDIGTAGFLDLIMVLVGFFGPYFLLPKAFQWGGSWLKAGSNAIANNAAVKKGGELGRKELGETLKRKQGEFASQYNPDDKMLKFRRGKLGFGRFKIPAPAVDGRMASRIRSGKILPTERNRRLTIRQGDEWKSERNDEALAFNKRKMEMGFSNGYEHDYRDPDTGELKHEKIEPGLKAGKQALVDMVGYDGNDPMMKRAAEMAIVQLKESNSIWELQNARIGGDSKWSGMRVGDTDAWQKKSQTTSEVWGWYGGKRPDLIPTVTSEEYGQNDEEIMKTVAKYAPEKYEGKTDADWTAYKQRNSGYLSKRLKEVRKKQDQLKTPHVRLDDPDRQAKALRDGYANASDSANYAEGWWDEMIAQANKGNATAQQEMLRQMMQLAGTGQAGLQVLGHLAAGPLRVKVNNALGGNDSERGDVLGKLIQMGKATDQESQEITAQIEQIAGLPKQKLQEVKAASSAAPGIRQSGGESAVGNRTSSGDQPTAAARSSSSGGAGNESGGGQEGTRQPSYSPTGAATGIDAQGIIDALHETNRTLRETVGHKAPPETRTIRSDLGEIKIQHTPGEAPRFQSQGGVELPSNVRYNVGNPPNNQQPPAPGA
jgi:hypothetical protein